MKEDSMYEIHLFGKKENGDSIILVGFPDDSSRDAAVKHAVKVSKETSAMFGVWSKPLNGYDVFILGGEVIAFGKEQFSMPIVLPKDKAMRFALPESSEATIGFTVQDLETGERHQMEFLTTHSGFQVKTRNNKKLSFTFVLENDVLVAEKWRTPEDGSRTLDPSDGSIIMASGIYEEE